MITTVEICEHVIAWNEQMIRQKMGDADDRDRWAENIRRLRAKIVELSGRAA